MQYKGAMKSLPQIAQELKVDAVAEGTVQGSGDRVRVTEHFCLTRGPTATCGLRVTSATGGDYSAGETDRGGNHPRTQRADH